jgi:hypothetical protein
VQAVEGVGGRVGRGEKAEGDVGADQVVVDGLGDADAAHAVLGEGGRDRHRPVSPDDDEGLELVGRDRAQALIELVHVGRPALVVLARVHLERVVAIARAQDRAPLAEHARDVEARELADAILGQAQEAVLDAEDADAVLIEGGLGHGPDDGVEAGAVTAAREHADTFDSAWWHGLFHLLRGAHQSFADADMWWREARVLMARSCTIRALG